MEEDTKELNKERKTYRTKERMVSKNKNKKRSKKEAE